MKDVTLNNGTVMTDAEFVRQRGMGDTLTEFVATKEDLKDLARTLTDRSLSDEFYLNICVGRSDIYIKNYTDFRLQRVMNFLPEMEVEIQERFRVGREKNNEDFEKYDAECKRTTA